MSGTQPHDAVGEFARFLAGLARRLDPSAGWYGVFARRDPDGLRACLEGRDVPPWDVVESLLYDLAGLPGDHAVSTVGARARRLHAQAVAGHDARPGGRSALQRRLAAMEREERHTALRVRDLEAALEAAVRTAGQAAGPGEAERLTEELAWAQNDHARAGARVGELRARLEALGEAEAKRRARVKAKVKRPVRPRGARFAGLEVPEEGAVAEAETQAEADEGGEAGAEYASDPAPEAAPRGARFAGAYGQEPGGGDGRAGDGRARPVTPPATAEARHAAATAVSRLAHLRATANGGLAHAELCAAANRPASELPLLIEELESAGLASDVPTLLWEAACLPPAGLAAAADALASAGRGADGGRLLRQAVARPVEEVGRAALALLERGRAGLALELLAALVRARAPQDAAAAAAPAPGALGPLLLEAAESVSPHRHSDIAHALRAARL
ncbi:hypothetical protein ACIRPT_36430 [Streptomyces sp. NPDC101227]|uniref:hypothetical protein n=1 Tax=Streptomyces sp. NPDC101227 TaxID=3366136 RepID=UPI003802F276